MSFAHITFCVLVSYFFIYFLRLLLHVNHVQPICTFLSCTVILIFKSTVYYHAHYLYFVLYIFFFFIHLILCILLCVVFFYNICTVHGADLTHISLLVNTLCIIVYVTNKSWTWTWPTTTTQTCRSTLKLWQLTSKSALMMWQSPRPSPHVQTKSRGWQQRFVGC